MKLGSFSISLAVKDLAASWAFYQKFGFEIIDGKLEDRWLLLKNDTAKIGLFQGMFESNIITFTPTDVRSIQTALKQGGIALTREADMTTTGPEHIILTDPDGNAIMLDQFND